MNEINNKVLRLASAIYAGKYGIKETQKRIKSIERSCGELDNPIELPDKIGISSKMYLDSLNCTVKTGIYSKDYLLEMAKVSEEVNREKLLKHRQLTVLAGCGIALLVIAGVVLIVVKLGGSK